MHMYFNIFDLLILFILYLSHALELLVFNLWSNRRTFIFSLLVKLLLAIVDCEATFDTLKNKMY